jgi:hypothetical protein
MMWLHWLMGAVILFGLLWLIVDAFDDRPERFADVDQLAKASRSVGETPGRSGLPPALLADRPGPIRRPLSNGRRK